MGRVLFDSEFDHVVGAAPAPGARPSAGTAPLDLLFTCLNLTMSGAMEHSGREATRGGTESTPLFKERPDTAEGTSRPVGSTAWSAVLLALFAALIMCPAFFVQNSTTTSADVGAKVHTQQRCIFPSA